MFIGACNPTVCPIRGFSFFKIMRDYIVAEAKDKGVAGVDIDEWTDVRVRATCAVVCLCYAVCVVPFGPSACPMTHLPDAHLSIRSPSGYRLLLLLLLFSSTRLRWQAQLSASCRCL